jgi:hypothetical protein
MQGTKLSRSLRTSLFASSALVSLTCTPVPAMRAVPAVPSTTGAETSRTVILVALDGVRWQEVFGGADPVLADRHHLAPEERVDQAHLVPNLARLMLQDGAAVGAPGKDSPMEASGPNFVSLPGYMEMLTGRSDSGCTNNQCARVTLPTVADDVAGIGLGEAAVISSWPVIENAAASAPENVVASAGRHGGGQSRRALSEDARVAPLLGAAARTPSPVGDTDFRRDADTGEVALAVLAAREPAFLFVGLGEPDEYGHRDDYRGYLDAIHRDDAIVGRIAEQVRARNLAGHPTTLLVTTDHGRAFGFTSHGKEHPESARVWMVASGAGVEARGFVRSPRVRHLADVGQTVRVLLGIEPSRAGAPGAALSELARPESTASRLAAR